MADNRRRDGEGVALTVLIGVFVGLVILLGALLLTGSGTDGADATAATIISTPGGAGHGHELPSSGLRG